MNLTATVRLSKVRDMLLQTNLMQAHELGWSFRDPSDVEYSLAK
jgi:hypothetical protein